MRLILVLCTLLLSACANNSDKGCGDKVLILWPNSDKNYSFQERQLPTLNSIYHLKGAAAEIYHEGTLTSDGYQGRVARPKLTRSGDVCVPMDTASSVALTTYAHFEQIYFFDRSLGIDSHLTWPRKVGVELRLRSPDGMTHNNAHYFGVSDSIGVIPYSLGGLNLALNRGILAHEHFHAHFQSQVMNPLNHGFEIIASAMERLFYPFFSVKPRMDEQDQSDTFSVINLNKNILRSWNEGLADFYGAIVTGEPDFFTPSKLQFAEGRELAGKIEPFAPGEEALRRIRVLPSGNLVDPRRSMVATSYEQGTILARLMYQISQQGGLDQKAFLKHIMIRLKNIPNRVAPLLERRVMNFEDVVPILLNGFALNRSSCALLGATLSKEMYIGSFKTCVR